MRPKVLAISTVVSVVVALCVLPAAGQPAFPRPEKLTIGYLPVTFHAQIFGAKEKGWLDELGVKDVEFVRFTTGIPMLQAMAAGQIDVFYDGIGPMLIAGHRGLPVKALAATSKDAMVFVTTETFARVYAAHQPPPAAFAAFEKQAGRKLRIGSPPRGATPNVFLHMWLTSIGVSPERDVTIVPMGGDQLVAAMAAGQVDSVVFGEPQITLILRADARFKVLLYGKDLVPGLPGGVVMVQQRLIDQYPAMVEKLVEIHLRANRLFNKDKDFFARTVNKLLGEKFLPLDVAQAAVRSPATRMVTDLRPLLKTLAVYDASEVTQGTWPAPLKIESILDLRFYDAVVKRHPELADEDGR
ncbi:MAG: transporter substrate-binding protein [candidate division NC10 bacterium]|nr:transporter substrate-binding protein [candidate division NC10 bacterium]